jgi:hypothetical protein
LVVLWTILAVSLPGCEGAARKYPVTGKVVYKDTEKPLPLGGVITLVPSNSSEPEASGRINPDGTFVISSQGAAAGEYRVRIAPELPDDPQSSSNLAAARAKILDARYLDAEKSGIVVTVEPKENDILVEVDRPKR